MQQGTLQKTAEQNIAQIKPVLSKELPSRVELQAEYDRAIQTLIQMTDGDAIITLVNMAKDNGIDVSKDAGKFSVPVASYGSMSVGQDNYRFIAFSGIHIQGAIDDVMDLLNDIQSGAYIETMVLKRVTVSETSIQYGGEEGGRRAEFREIIQALDVMTEDNGLLSILNPISYGAGLATNFMGDNPETTSIMEGFPDNITTAIEKGYTGNTTIKNGYILFGHDKVLPDDPTQYQSVNYYSDYNTNYYYTCESNGLVRQWSDSDVSIAKEYTETAGSTMELKASIDINIYIASE
ncbi:hypothetical protein ACFLTB_05685 [Chloroflexota bacterium]